MGVCTINQPINNPPPSSQVNTCLLQRPTNQPINRHQRRVSQVNTCLLQRPEAHFGGLRREEEALQLLQMEGHLWGCAALGGGMEGELEGGVKVLVCGVGRGHGGRVGGRGQIACVCVALGGGMEGELEGGVRLLVCVWRWAGAWRESWRDGSDCSVAVGWAFFDLHDRNDRAG